MNINKKLKVRCGPYKIFWSSKSKRVEIHRNDKFVRFAGKLESSLAHAFHQEFVNSLQQEQRHRKEENQIPSLYYKYENL